MRVFRLLSVSILLVALPLLADEKIRCESKGGKKVCPATQAIGSVVLLNQRSISACTEGETWGYNHDAIWVDNGCRGDFQVLTRRSSGEKHDRGGPYDDHETKRSRDRLVCESSGDRHFCPADTSYGVTIARTIGSRDCIEGRNWGYNDRGVWVDRGCRAEFVVGRDRDGYGDDEDRRSSSRSDVIRCESKDNHKHLCRVEGLLDAEVKKQLSISDCKYEESWGYNRDGVWVTDGCRADFLVRIR